MNTNQNPPPQNRYSRRQSVLATSDAKTDSKPIDCILVYDLNEKKPEEEENKNGVTTNHRLLWSLSERRKRFEEYLEKKQGLILERVVCIKKRISLIFVFFY